MKISIITVTKNSNRFVKDAILSVNSQSYENIEHIFIDGHSKDDTVNTIKKTSSRISHIISEKDESIYDALNKGINASTGDVIGFLHSDDILSNNNIIKEIAELFILDKDLKIAYGDLDYISKNNNRIIRRWRSGKFKIKNFLNGWMPPHPTFYMVKSSYESYGLFNCKYKISADYDSILRYMYKNKQKNKYLPKVIVKMRVGGKSNNSIKHIYLKLKEDYDIMKKNNLPAFRTLFLKNFLKIKQFF